MNTVNDDVDGDRLAAKTSGATVTDINAYRAASASAGATDTGSTYISPRIVSLFLLLALAFVLFLFLPRR